MFELLSFTGDSNECKDKSSDEKDSYYECHQGVFMNILVLRLFRNEREGLSKEPIEESSS